MFGGGHVVLPLLQAEVVPPGWVTNEQFLAGYGAAQAVPGPLFTFAAYLGAVMRPWPTGWLGALVALVAIFLPSFLLVVGALPFWDALRARPAFQAALLGINAAVVGLLLAALYHPVWTSAIHAPADFALALAAFGLLALGARRPGSWWPSPRRAARRSPCSAERGRAPAAPQTSTISTRKSAPGSSTATRWWIVNSYASPARRSEGEKGNARLPAIALRPG